VTEKVIYGQKAIGDFLEELATESPPLPAGGCAVALAGALSAALEQFVTQLTIKKRKNPDSTVGLIEILYEKRDTILTRPPRSSLPQL
jgi:formiminotetrahydrofolate cyclodeaminase